MSYDNEEQQYLEDISAEAEALNEIAIEEERILREQNRCKHCIGTGYEPEKSAHIPIYNYDGTVDFDEVPVPCEHCSGTGKEGSE